MGRYLKARLADLFLVVAWLVVLFQIIQIARVEGETTGRMIFSHGVMVVIGIAVTVLWWRARRRLRS